MLDPQRTYNHKVHKKGHGQRSMRKTEHHVDILSFSSLVSLTIAAALGNHDRLSNVTDLVPRIIQGKDEISPISSCDSGSSDFYRQLETEHDPALPAELVANRLQETTSVICW